MSLSTPCHDPQPGRHGWRHSHQWNDQAGARPAKGAESVRPPLHSLPPHVDVPARHCGSRRAHAWRAPVAPQSGLSSTAERMQKEGDAWLLSGCGREAREPLQMRHERVCRRTRDHE
jgi:hypothetical protein